MFKNMNLLPYLFFLSLQFLWAESYVNISGKYQDLSSSWLNDQISDENVIIDLSELEEIVSRRDSERNKYYWMAKIQLLKGFIWFQAGEQNNSIEELEKSTEFILESMIDGEYSEGWRILSEAGSYIMLQKGVGYIIANSKNIKEQAEKSLSLNSENRRASLIVAQGFLNAPRIFGGDKKRAIEMLELLSKKENLDYESQFLVMSALSEAYVTLKRDDDAIKNYKIMLNLYPGSTFLREKLNNLQ